MIIHLFHILPGALSSGQFVSLFLDSDLASERKQKQFTGDVPFFYRFGVPYFSAIFVSTIDLSSLHWYLLKIILIFFKQRKNFGVKKCHFYEFLKFH